MKNNEIDFGKQTISKVFEDWYTIPSYQRNYVWEGDQVFDFLKDMKDNYVEHANDEYFLGSYIKQENGVSMILSGCLTPWSQGR